MLPTFIVWHWHQPLFLFIFLKYTYIYIYILYCVLTNVMSVSVCMHACIPPSCDWLNDFLKGCWATISFWHLITVRSHRAPADPLWYGPCTCSSPLSQVPIIIIKTPLPPPQPPNTHTHTHIREHLESKPPILAWGHAVASPQHGWLRGPPSLSLKYNSGERDLSPLQCSCTKASLQWELKVAVDKETAFPFPLCPDTLPKLAWRVTWQTLAIWKKRPGVKSEAGFRIIFSDWLALTFS